MRSKVSTEWEEEDMRGYRKNRSVLEEKRRGTLSSPLGLDECALCGKSCALFKITSFPPVSLLARHTSTSSGATSGCLESTEILSKQINNLCLRKFTKSSLFLGLSFLLQGAIRGSMHVEHLMWSAVVKYVFFRSLFHYVLRCLWLRHRAINSTFGYLSTWFLDVCRLRSYNWILRVLVEQHWFCIFSSTGCILMGEWFYGTRCRMLTFSVIVIFFIEQQGWATFRI